MKALRPLLGLAIASLITATAHAGSLDLPPADPNHPYTVSPLMALGEDLILDYVGFTAFGNEVERHKSEEPFNSYLGDVTQGHLQRVAGIAIKPTSLDLAAVQAAANVPQGFFAKEINPKLYTLLEQSKDREQIDAFLIAIPGGPNANCMGGEGCIAYGRSGYGLHNKLNRNNTAYISVSLIVVDAKTLKVLARERADQLVALPFDDWKPKWQDYTPEEQQQINTALCELLASRVPKALDKLGLKAS